MTLLVLWPTSPQVYIGTSIAVSHMTSIQLCTICIVLGPSIQLYAYVIVTNLESNKVLFTVRNPSYFRG